MRAVRILLLIAASAVLLAEAGSSSEASGEALKVGIWEREFPEMGRVITGVLSAGKDAYLFMPPARWEMATDGGGGIRMTGPNGGSIDIRTALSNGQKADSLAVDGMRQRAKRRLPDGKIVQEMTCYTESQSGPGFDLDWQDERGGQFMARIAFVEVGGRCFEFTLLAPAAQFVTELGTFTGLMTSFQLAEPTVRP